MGSLPLRLKDLLTYGGYEFESAIRASVIVGAVGAGGIGTELVGSLNMTDYHRATTLIVMLVALIASVDFLGFYVRRQPRLLLVLAAFGVAAAWHHWPHLMVVAQALKTFRTMVPPQLPAEALRELPTLIARNPADRIRRDTYGSDLRPATGSSRGQKCFAIIHLFSCSPPA